MNVEVVCPYCGELTEVAIDEAGGRSVEDCVVCCRPIDVWVHHDGDGDPIVNVARGDA